MTDSKDVDRSVAIVTGSAGGIGRAVAELFLESDSNLRCAAVDLKEGHAAAMIAEFGDRVLEVTCDVSDSHQVQAAMSKVVEWTPHVQVLVNCAGIQRAHDSKTLPEELWEWVLKVNLSGTFFWCQNAGRVMSDGDGGAIVNVSSVAAHFGFPLRAPYAASKAAIESLTKTLATEWAADGIRVNAVAPGYIETPLMRESIESGRLDEAFARRLHALERFAEPREVAEVIHFLASPKSGFVTGEVVMVDGGFSVRKVN